MQRMLADAPSYSTNKKKQSGTGNHPTVQPEIDEDNVEDFFRQVAQQVPK